MMLNKIVLITGAVGGFGQAIAHTFAAQGAHLALLDRDEEKLDLLAQELRSDGTLVQAEVADLSTAQGVRAGISAVLAPFAGQLDILIANVGILVAGAFEQLSDEQILQGLTMNFLTHVWACRAVLPLMREREEASIVLIGSDQGSQPDEGLFPYAQAKAALHSLTKLLAREYAPAIRVNAVAPGMADTPMVQRWFSRQARKQQRAWQALALEELLHRNVPINRLAEPEEVAEAVSFLVQNAFCTGTILDVSGGNVRGV